MKLIAKACRMKTILEMKLHIQNIYIAYNQNLFAWIKLLVKIKSCVNKT